MRWCRQSMLPMASTSADPAGDWSFSMEKFADYLKRENIAWPVTEKGKLSTSNKTFESMGKAFSAVGTVAAAALYAQQAAQGQAGGRKRRAKSHDAVAVSVQDVAHPAKGQPVDFLAGGVFAESDQAGSGHGGRLRRLVESWNS